MSGKRFSARAAAGATGVIAALLASYSISTASATPTARSFPMGHSLPQAAIPVTHAHDQTITVWSMQGDYSMTTLKAISKEFTALTGAKVSIQIQQWTDISTKVNTALATSDPPDVIDVGNTQASSYAAGGGFLDLTQYEKTLEQGQTWLAGLVDPAILKGQLYAVPGLAGTNEVLYNKEMWHAVGLTSAPKTWSQLTSDLNELKAAHKSDSKFSVFYLPAETWIDDLGWLWDAGGQIATLSHGKWVGDLASPASQKGLKAFKTFQNDYSTPATQTLTTGTPAEEQVFADGNASAMIDGSGDPQLVVQDNPKLRGQVGTFDLPSEWRPGQSMPVMVGGSDWGISTKSQNKDLALLWVKIAASPQIETKYVWGVDDFQPNSIQLSAKLAKTAPPLLVPFLTSSAETRSTPPSAGWNVIQDDDSINDFFGALASGRATPAAAAASFDSHLDSVLNQAS